MPEEQKSAGSSAAEASTAAAAENGTRTSSPSQKSPSNKGKTVLARITLLDGTVKDFPIEVCSIFLHFFNFYFYFPYYKLHFTFFFFSQRKARGQELLDKICQSMNLLEKDYFGLIYADRHDPRNWLDLDKRIGKFIKS